MSTEILIKWMIPNYLYLTQLNYMAVPEPLWVIQAPHTLVWTLFYIWLIGFLFVLIWKVSSHFIFRFHILHDAAAVTDPEILKIWQTEIEKACLSKPKFHFENLADRNRKSLSKQTKISAGTVSPRAAYYDRPSR